MNPFCQSKDCGNKSTVMLRSKWDGSELHLCRSCASSFRKTGWEVVTGDIKLRPPASKD